MKRFRTIRIVRREQADDQREPTILDHGDPITVKLTREIEERKRRLGLGTSHPLGL
ncbi:MAG: hypothetical protein AAF437_05405 [Pseudomonadota bacterium]